MDIQIISDLHLDFKPNYKYAHNVLEPEAEILLIAGDTCEYRNSSIIHQKYHETFFNKWKTVIEVPGNHDFYNLLAPEKKLERCFESYSMAHDSIGQSNWHYINNGMIDLSDNVRVICTTLWGKISPVNHVKIMQDMPDYEEIRNFTVDKSNAWHDKSAAFLDNALKESAGKRVIILTHHLPLTSLINERFSRSELNEAYVGDVPEIIGEYSDRIKIWVHGHSHDFKHKEYVGVQFVRNPLGYVKYDEHLTYSPLVLEI